MAVICRTGRSIKNIEDNGNGEVGLESDEDEDASRDLTMKDRMCL